MKHQALLALGLFGAACGSGEDIVVFEAGTGAGGSSSLSSSGGASTASESSATTASESSATMTTESSSTEGSTTATTGSLEATCVYPQDCDPYSFCKKTECGGVGTCEPRPVFCDPEPEPVCGCDDVTYWNDCFRQQVGIGASRPGQCQEGARRCDFAEDCGVFGGACVRLLFGGEPCPSPDTPYSQGTCWAVPGNCEDYKDPQYWQLCPPPDYPYDEPMCMHTCFALRSGFPHLKIQDHELECPEAQ